MSIPSSEGLRVLVVDDEESIRRLSQRYLVKLGHYVNTASDGRQALELLDQGEYDVIVSDMRMPGMGGRELLKHLRKKNNALVRRLIFLTADEGIGVHEARAAGCPVLPKPIDLIDFARAIDAVASANASQKKRRS